MESPELQVLAYEATKVTATVKAFSVKIIIQQKCVD